MYNNEKFAAVLAENPVIPVVAVRKAEDCVPLAETLVSGGINIIEITLRTEAAFEAIKRLVASGIKISIGAGTVFNTEQFKKLEDLGVDFIVSPGTTDALLEYASASKMPYLPGVMTSSEILKTYNYGFKFQKLFPASLAGGIKAIQAYSGVYGGVSFCPTGGIKSDNFMEFLAQSNVCALGGTWIASANEIAGNSWESISSKVLEIKAKMGK